MKQEYQNYAAESRVFHRQSRDPKTYTKADSVSSMLALINKYRKSIQEDSMIF